MADAVHHDPAALAAPGASACTAPDDLARRLDALLSDRDTQRSLWERHHAHLVRALLAQPGTDAARDRAQRACLSVEAADQATDAALRLLMDALRCRGVVVDVPDSDDEAADAGPSDYMGGEL